MRTHYYQAKRLASTVNLSRADWLRLRGLGIGSSDAAAAIGLSRYKSALRLWLEKSGQVEAEDLSEKESVLWGTLLEPVLAKAYAERSGLRVRRVNAILQHPEHPFMLANLDREVVTDLGVGVLEIKTAGYYSAPQWEDSVPEAYQCQVLHQLAVTGHAWADVAVLIAGQDFRVYRIERDDGKIADLIEREQAFWRCVQQCIPPQPDGSDDAGRALQTLYRQDNGICLDCTESLEGNQLFHQLLQLKQQKEATEQEESKVKQQLQTVLGTASEAVFQDGRISWKKAKDRLVPDIDKLSQEIPDLWTRFGKLQAGSRRFTIQSGKGAV